MGGLSEGEDSNRVCEGNMLDRLAIKAWKWLGGAGCVFSGELSLMHSSLFQACLVQAQVWSQEFVKVISMVDGWMVRCQKVAAMWNQWMRKQ